MKETLLWVSLVFYMLNNNLIKSNKTNTNLKKYKNRAYGADKILNSNNNNTNFSNKNNKLLKRISSTNSIDFLNKKRILKLKLII